MGENARLMHTEAHLAFFSLSLIHRGLICRLSGIARAENLIPETVSVKAGEKPSDKDDQDIKINYSSEPKTPLSQEDIERALI